MRQGVLIYACNDRAQYISGVGLLLRMAGAMLVAKASGKDLKKNLIGSPRER